MSKWSTSACRYHKPFMDSEFHCKHQVTVLTGSQVYLADILYNEHALCYFMEVSNGGSLVCGWRVWVSGPLEDKMFTNRGGKSE